MPSLARNPYRAVEFQSPFAKSRDPLAFHRLLPAYSPTPLRLLPQLARRLGVGRVMAKDETSRLGLPAFKMLGASWATFRALSERLASSTGESPKAFRDIESLRSALMPLTPLTLAAATDGNHGRAVARMAKLLGLEAQIFVPSDMARARIQAIEGEGAEVIVVDGVYDDAVARSADESGEARLVISDTSWPGYESVPKQIIEGYSTIFWEIDDALISHGWSQPDLVAVPVGVGALACSALTHYRDKPEVVTLLSVEPIDAACVMASILAGELTEVPGPHRSVMSGLNCGLPSQIAFPALRDGFDVCAAIEDGFAEDAMRSLAAEGVESGETGAAGLAGLLAFPEICQELGAEASVLLLITEGPTDPESYQRIVGSAPTGSPPSDR